MGRTLSPITLALSIALGLCAPCASAGSHRAAGWVLVCPPLDGIEPRSEEPFSAWHQAGTFATARDAQPRPAPGGCLPGEPRARLAAYDATSARRCRRDAHERPERCETLDWASLRYQHTAAVRAALAERYAPATANKMLAALRGVLRQAWRLGYMTAEDYRRAADLRPIQGKTLPRGRALTPGELRTLFAAAAEEPHPTTRARDVALLAVLYGAGLRRAEVVAIDVADYDPEAGVLNVRRAKGRRQRAVFVPNGTRQAVDAWLAVRGVEPGPLLCPVDKAGRVTLRALTPQSVFDRLRHLGARAGLPPFSPHDLRRSFISDLLDNGADLAVVQAMAGHANPATTARYDRRGDHAKRRAAGMLVVPL